MAPEDYRGQLIRERNVCYFAAVCYSNGCDIDMGLAPKSSLGTLLAIQWDAFLRWF